MINLGDKKWGVKDSGLLAYKQVGSKFFNKDFDFTRSSDATYIDKNGVLQTQSLYNLIDYSNDFSQWTTGRSSLGDTTISPNGVLNATGLIANTVSDDHYISRGFSVTNGVEYTFSAFIKLGDTDKTWVRLWNTAVGFVDFNLGDATIGTISNAVGSIIDSGNGWYRCSITYTANTTGFNAHRIYIMDDDNDKTFVGDNVSNYIYIYGAQLVEGTEPLDYQYTNGRVGIPRIDFSDGVGALLLESQRSNVLLKSNQFDVWGMSASYTITPNQQGIYGTNNAFLVDKNTDANAYINQNASITGDYTISIYAKANTADGVFIYTTNGYGGFNLQNGTFISGGGGYSGQSIKSIGNGWYRCSISATGTVSSLLVKLVDSNNQNTSGSIYIQHAQVESGSYPTSIIETTTSQVTRIADVANNCGTEQDFNSEEGVLYAEVARFKGDTTPITLSINDGSNSNMVSFYYFSTNVVYFDILSSSPNVTGSITIDDTSNLNKIALKYKSGDVALWVNGQELITKTNAISLSTLNELSFSYGDNSSPFYGKARSVKYFPTALTDEELENLTT